MRLQRPVSFAVACGLTGALSGCGSAGPAGLNASTSGALRQQLAKVQAAAARGDRGGALDALSAFSGDLAHHTGQLTAAQQAALRTGISRLRQRIEAVTAPAAATTTATTPAAPTTTATTPAAPATTTTTTTTQQSAPAPAPPASPAHPGHGHGHEPKGGAPGHGGHGGHGHGGGD